MLGAAHLGQHSSESARFAPFLTLSVVSCQTVNLRNRGSSSKLRKGTHDRVSSSDGEGCVKGPTSIFFEMGAQELKNRGSSDCSLGEDLLKSKWLTEKKKNRRLLRI